MSQATITDLASDPFFLELEAEIAKITAQDKLKAERDLAKKRANTTSLSSAARAEASGKFKALSAILEANEWGAISTVALFSEQTCDGCGSVHRIFLQFMELQQLIRKPTTQRWVRVSKPMPLLPKQTMIQPVITHLCADCCDDHGFNLAHSLSLTSRVETVGPSMTYVQEDLNEVSTH